MGLSKIIVDVVIKINDNNHIELKHKKQIKEDYKMATKSIAEYVQNVIGNLDDEETIEDFINEIQANGCIEIYFQSAISHLMSWYKNDDKNFFNALAEIIEDQTLTSHKVFELLNEIKNINNLNQEEISYSDLNTLHYNIILKELLNY